MTMNDNKSYDKDDNERQQSLRYSRDRQGTDESQNGINRNSTYQVHKRPIVCYKCQQPGHYSYECKSSGSQRQNGTHRSTISVKAIKPY